MIDATASEAQLVHQCENIGPRERKVRLWNGIVGSAVTVAGGVAVVALHASTPVRLLLGIPAFLAAISFFQFRAHTCVAFVAGNVKVMGDSRRSAQKVTDAAERAAFRRKAAVIFAQSFAATAVVMALLLALP